jgi:DNA (cytosine-5)-methyltransferase 1
MSKYNKENPLRVTTLFSGYDSQCLALERLKQSIPNFDYELVNWCEIDKYAIQAHNALFPQWADRNLGDISLVDWSKANQCDLLTYSSPCQDFSNAGLQKGGEEGSGTRSSLLWECRKAIEQLKPKYLLMENVKALVSKKFAPTFLAWVETLNKLGYTSYYRVVNATNCGVPQNRERIFVVSVLGDHKPFHFQQPIPLEKRLKDVLEPEVDDKYVLSDQAIEGFLKHNENHEEKGTGFI